VAQIDKLRERTKISNPPGWCGAAESSFVV
jgi:hypothetical protein